MSLEAALTYLVALAVPVWLLVEQIVSRRRSRDEQAVQPESRERKATEPGEPTESETPRPAYRADSVSGGIRRKAA